MEIVNFTPLPAFIGGCIIGLSAALLLWLNGRIAGVSGIAGGIIYPNLGDMDWRIFFVIGLILGGLIYQWMGFSPDVHSIQAVVSSPMLLLGGFLVGVGSTLGSGCTSGHAVCGIARFSQRSIVATLTFMLAAAITVYLIRHVVGV